MNMTNEELLLTLKNASADERTVTARIVELIAEAVHRKLWAERGYPSAHQWLVKELGYSDSSAGRRLDAARILNAVPDVADKLAAGTLTLSALSQVQSAIFREERRTGCELPEDYQREVVRKIEHLSSAGAARVIAIEFPEIARAPKESLKPIGTDGWSLTVALDAEQMTALLRARELLSHSHPGASWAEVLAHLATEHAKRADPLQRENRRPTPQRFSATEEPSTPGPTPNRRPLTRPVRDAALAKAGGACEFRNANGARCGGRVRVEVDHVLARALGGTNDPANLRCLCAQHNRFKSEREMGQRRANAWKRTA